MRVAQQPLKHKHDAPGNGSDLFLRYLGEKLPLIQRALVSRSASPLTEDKPAEDLNRYLYTPLARFTSQGGKRIRPVLCLLGAEAAGGAASDALSAGIAIELFQSAALIHDDIADESLLRRDQPCLYVSEGTGVAINVGDLALTQVFDVVLRDTSLSDDRRIQVLSELVAMERHTLEGQALDLGWARDNRWDITPDDYLYMVLSKTAWYSAASPLSIGAYAAGAPDSTVAGLAELGRHAGIAFQVQDDLLNLVGDAQDQGKDFQSDITEGKRTLAVVHALAHLSSKDRTELITLLESGTTDPTSCARAVELIEHAGGIERCQQLAQTEAARTQTIADELAQAGSITAESRLILRSMANFFIERSF